MGRISLKIRIITLLLLLVGSFTVLGQNAPKESGKAAQMRQLNNQVLGLHGQMRSALDSASGSQLREQALQVLKSRREALIALMRENPQKASTFAFSQAAIAELAASFPGAAGLLEQHVTVQGKLETWVADYPDHRSQSFFVIKTPGGDLSLHFSCPEPSIKETEQIQVTGVLVGSDMAVESAHAIQNGNSGSSMYPAGLTLALAGSFFLSPGVWRRRLLNLVKASAIYGLIVAMLVFGCGSTFAQSSGCSTQGAQNTAVLLVNVPGGALPAGVTQPSMQDAFFATNTPGVSLDGFLREASYGQASATGDVFGPFNLTGAYSTCADVGGALLNDAIAAAVASGAKLNNYSRIFLVFPDIYHCGWAGFASNACTISSPSGTFNASLAFIAAGYATQRSQGVQVASHELGHNMGLQHSGTLSAGTDVLGPISSPGSVTDMGDYWSTLGGPVLGLYPAPQKSEVLGWMSSSNYQTVQSSGTYTIQPLETNPAGLEALRIQRGTGNNAWLWIEYRQPLGNYDSTLLHQPFSGALIHYEDINTSSGHTYLPNFTPADTTGNSPALAAGQTWTDPYSNVSLSVLSATTSGLTVSVNYGATPCTTANPTVAMSPADPSIYAGSTATYTVTVSNNDSAGCSANTFSLGSSQPSSWPTTFSATSVTLNPGQSTAVTMYKTGPSGTAPGTYASDANASTSSHVGSASANVTVMAAAPSMTATLSISGSSFALRSTVPMTVTVMNGGTPVSGAYVTFKLVAPNGKTTTFLTTADANGIATWNYKTSQRSLTGTYSVSAQASLSSGTKKSTGTQPVSSNTAMFTLQ